MERVFKFIYNCVVTCRTTMVTLLYALVTVQLICYAPRTALNVYEFYLVSIETDWRPGLTSSLQALTYHEMFLSHKWLVDLSHLMLAVATASNVAILAAQVTFTSLRNYDKFAPRISVSGQLCSVI